MVYKYREGMKYNQISTSMEISAMKKFLTVLIAVAMCMLIFGARDGESAIAISLNPCTLDKCIDACKNVLKEKFQSASCVINPKGKLCVCLG